MELSKRKPTRLSQYDYRTPGAYFVTICTKNKKRFLCEIVGDDAHIVPKKAGTIAEKYIRSIPWIDKYIIMPNHIHMIILIENGPMWASAPTQSISTIIKSFKTLVAKEMGQSIFQRSFHDHIIRNEADYRRIWEYIDTNAMKWAEDCYYTKEEL